MKSDETYRYDELFYDYMIPGASRSARALLPVVLGAIPVQSVLDIGSGAGAWLAEYRRLGILDYFGVDGDYVMANRLMIEPSRFFPQDITRPFKLDRQFDLVQCLEVAEHIPLAASGVLVDNIVQHGKLVLFSAAVPGQGGERHVNERPYEFWRDMFADRGFRLFDFVRPRVLMMFEIESWYRYNVMLFVHDAIIPTLSPDLVRTRVADTARIADVSPLIYRARKAVMRRLSPGMLSRLAILKHQLIARSATLRKG
jgi:SAM-dependent methyltransferase